MMRFVEESFTASAELKLPQACLGNDFLLYVEVEQPHQLRGWKVASTTLSLLLL